MGFFCLLLYAQHLIITSILAQDICVLHLHTYVLERAQIKTVATVNPKLWTYCSWYKVVRECHIFIIYVHIIYPKQVRYLDFIASVGLALLT